MDKQLLLGPALNTLWKCAQGPNMAEQNSRQCTAEEGTTASCAQAPRTSSCLGRSGSPRTQFAHRPGSGGSGFGVGALRPPAPGCSTTLGASATPRAVGRKWQGELGSLTWQTPGGSPNYGQPELALLSSEARGSPFLRVWGLGDHSFYSRPFFPDTSPPAPLGAGRWFPDLSPNIFPTLAERVCLTPGVPKPKLLG